MGGGSTAFEAPQASCATATAMERTRASDMGPPRFTRNAPGRSRFHKAVDRMAPGSGRFKLVARGGRLRNENRRPCHRSGLACDCFVCRRATLHRDRPSIQWRHHPGSACGGEQARSRLSGSAHRTYRVPVGLGPPLVLLDGNRSLPG
jgi:hypothetical protein